MCANASIWPQTQYRESDPPALERIRPPIEAGVGGAKGCDWLERAVYLAYGEANLADELAMNIVFSSYSKRAH